MPGTLPRGRWIISHRQTCFIRMRFAQEPDPREWIAARVRRKGVALKLNKYSRFRCRLLECYKRSNEYQKDLEWGNKRAALTCRYTRILFHLWTSITALRIDDRQRDVRRYSILSWAGVHEFQFNIRVTVNVILLLTIFKDMAGRTFLLFADTR
jgi:hypothetical protein